MGAMAYQITSLTIVYSVADQSKHQSSASLGFVQGTHWWPVNSPHKWPVTRKLFFPFDDVIMYWGYHLSATNSIHVIYEDNSFEIMAWMNNYITNIVAGVVVTPSGPNFNGGVR